MNTERKAIDIAAHDLRGMLVPAKTYTQLLLSGMLGPLSDKQLEALQTIEHCVQKQEDKIDSMLDMVKAEERRLELTLALENLLEIVQSAAAAVQRECARKNLSFIADLDSRAALVNADRHRLRRIFTVLLARGAAHTPQGGRLGVELRYVSAERARIRFWDGGTGSRAAELKLLGWSAHEQFAGRQRGDTPLDIDLAPVFDVVQAHGGNIATQSTPAAGSTCLIYLPVQTRPRTADSKSGRATGTEAGAATARRALLAGLCEAQAGTLAEALKTAGVDTTAASSAVDAVRAAQENHFHFVFIADPLPDFESRQLAAAIRAQRPEDKQAIYLLGREAREESPEYTCVDTEALTDPRALVARAVKKLAD